MSPDPLESLARILRRCLVAGHRVEIERLGTFLPSPSGGFSFLPDGRPTVFLAYVEEDRDSVLRLYDALESSGFNPWMDQKKLMAGQNWPRALEGAIHTADFFVACLSRRAIGKRGTFQSEMRYALDCARHTPLDGVFFLPARLEKCAVPRIIQQNLQYVDLFPSFDDGVSRLADTMRREMGRRAALARALAPAF